MALDAPPHRLNAAPATAGPAAAQLQLLLFSVDPDVVVEASEAGVGGFVVDWERRGKARRQAGEGTQINHHTLADLVATRAATRQRVVCRLNTVGPWTAGELDRAVDAGADEVLLPMVRRPAEVDRALDLLGGRCGLGILVETQAAVDAVEELAARPLSRIYLGLNDLRIDRGATSLFTPLVDGTADRVAAACAGATPGGRRGVPFGAAGLTLPGRGCPVPSSLIAAELSRLGAGFTFLRRSFTADTAGLPLAPAVAAIHGHLSQLADRGPDQRDADRRALRDVLAPAAQRCPA